MINYILIGISVVSIICVLLMIFVNRGLNREIHAMTQTYQNILHEIDEVKKDEGTTVQTVQSSLTSFGTMISANQRDAAESMDNRLREMNARISAMAVENEQKLDNIRTGVEKKISDLTEENNRKLTEMRETVDEKLQKTLEERISKSFQLVSDRLEQVYKGLGEMQTLAQGVGDLKKVISNVKTRGILGEVQLGAILEEILAPEQYEHEIATIPGSRDHVEYAVRMPGNGGGTIWLPIDSKFPGETYARLVDAYEKGDNGLVEAAYKSLERTIKNEAKDIRDKYVQTPYTTDFAIMFLPFEGLYAEVVRRGLIETLQREFKVNIAGPTTMAALLNSLQMGFRTLAIQQHSAEVWELLGAVKSEFANYNKVLENAREKLRMADGELDKLMGTRTRAIERKLRTVEALDEVQSRKLLEISNYEVEE